VCVASQPAVDFLFQTCHTSLICPFFCLTVASNFFSSWDECPTTLWTLPTFSELGNMSRFQTCWFLHLLLHRCRHATVPEPFSYLARRFLHTREQRSFHSLHKCGTHPVSGHRPRGLTSDLFSSQTRPELGGSPVESCLCSGDGQTSPAFSSQSIQCLYINHPLSVNKLVLSYLLLHLLLPWSVYALGHGQTSPAYSSRSVQLD
jgi:hypothetical protein